MTDNSQKHNIIIDQEFSGSRLDRFCRKYFPNLSQTIIEKAIRKKDIRLNGKVCKSSIRLQLNDNISFSEFFINIVCNGEKASQHSKANFLDEEFLKVKKIIDENIIFEDDDILVINKPYDIAVQGGSKQKIFLDLALRERAKLVHRLDKDTGGILITAKSMVAARSLSLQFQNHEVKKFYLALVFGHMPHVKGMIDIPISKDKVKILPNSKLQFSENQNNGSHARHEHARHEHARHEHARHEHARHEHARHEHATHKQVHAGSEFESMQTYDACKESTKNKIKTGEVKKSLTHWLRINELGRKLNLLHLIPITGRTHQLRVHLSHIGHPIIGDNKYGSPESTDIEGLSKKLHLFCQKIIIKHPTTQKQLILSAPVTGHFKKSLDFFEIKPKEYSNCDYGDIFLKKY